MKKVLIINGHPDKESYSSALANAYKKGAIRAGAEVREIILANLEFNPNLASVTENVPTWKRIFWTHSS